MNLFKKALKNIINTKDTISKTFSQISFKKNLSTDDLETMEECLLEADVSWPLTEKIIAKVKSNKNDFDSWESLLKKSIYDSIIPSKDIYFKKIIIVIGVNGSGKTTTSAKLANMFKNDNKSVTLVAADTFRAAAINQLEIWAKRINVNFISNINSNDPASIAYDGAKSGITKGQDYVIIDTAGRLHTSANLMKELGKVYNVVSKLSKDISVVMTLDANIGQNCIKQVQEFNKFMPIDGLIVNKMDGSAKGGSILSIIDELNMPVVYIGVGESFNHIQKFVFDDYINALLGDK